MVTFKISLGIFFLRIFPMDRNPRLVIYLVILLNIVFGVARCVFVLADQCHVVETIMPGASSCSTTAPGFLQLGAFCTFLGAMTDMVLAGLAVWVIRQMSLARVERTIACALLLLGTLSGIVSFVRFAAVVHRIATESSITQALAVSRWSIIELGQGIIAASLATLRPLLREAYRRFHPSLLTPEESNEHSVSPEASSRAKARALRRWTSDEFFLTMGRFNNVEAAENDLQRRRTKVVSTSINISTIAEVPAEDLEACTEGNTPRTGPDKHLPNV